MSLGPLMLDLKATLLQDEERELLKHPKVGGVILFARNYQNPEQLSELCSQIHGLRNPSLLIAVDHEGGRVQRFHEKFSRLPPCRCYGQQYDLDKQKGIQLSEQGGWLMATELLAVGVDFSFAPVLDLDKGVSQVIGDRAFHRNIDATAVLAKAFMRGMKQVGMAAVGKHFPGHGAVREDSHHEIPEDKRRYEDIEMSDLLPFERLINAGLPAIMPAHVIYSIIDDRPAGYSSKWLQQILRNHLGFQGVIFSDDINMKGAEFADDFPARASSALTAGCDMVLICNNRDAAIQVLNELDYEAHSASQARLIRMHGRDIDTSVAKLREDKKWQSTSNTITELQQAPELDLGDDEIQS